MPSRTILACGLGVVFQQPARTSQSAFDIAIFRTGAGFQSKSAVSPKLSLSAETMRGLDQRHRQGGANRSQCGNLPKFDGDGMLATLRQQLAARLLAQILQHVQLLVESFGSATDAGFLDLAQPRGSMTSIVDVPAGTGDRPAAIDRFQPTHDSGQIFDDGQVAPG